MAWFLAIALLGLMRPGHEAQCNFLSLTWVWRGLVQLPEPSSSLETCLWLPNLGTPLPATANVQTIIGPCSLFQLDPFPISAYISSCLMQLNEILFWQTRDSVCVCESLMVDAHHPAQTQVKVPQVWLCPRPFCQRTPALCQGWGCNGRALVSWK